MKKITVVVPVYNEAKSIPVFWHRLQAVIATLKHYEWSVLFVNDGSKDDSRKIIIGLGAEIIDFSRNFGKEAALTAGLLDASNSDAVLTIDADLQHPPEVISEMVKIWEGGANIVIGVRRENMANGFIRRWASRLFAYVMRRISTTEFIRGSTDFRLFDSMVVKEFSKFNERVRIFRGLIDWMGFERCYIYFDAPIRAHGVSNYSNLQLFRMALNGLTTYSLWPLRIVGIMGFFITSISFILLIIMLFNYIISDNVIYTALSIFVVANTFLIGLVLMLLGLISIYIGNIQTEVLGRPLFIKKLK